MARKGQPGWVEGQRSWYERLKKEREREGGGLEGDLRYIIWENMGHVQRVFQYSAWS